MAVQAAQSLMTRTATHYAEILSDSHRALFAIDKARGHWTAPVIRDIKRQVGLIQDWGDRVILSVVHRREGRTNGIREGCSKACSDTATEGHALNIDAVDQSEVEARSEGQQIYQ